MIRKEEKLERGVKIHIMSKNTILDCPMIRKEEQNRKKRVSKYHFRLSYDQKRRKIEKGCQNTYNVQKYHFFTFEKGWVLFINNNIRTSLLNDKRSR